MSILGLQIHNTYTTHVKKCVLLCVVLGSSLIEAPNCFTSSGGERITKSLVIGKSIFFIKVTVHKDQKSPLYVSNLKKPAFASKRDMLELATLCAL